MEPRLMMNKHPSTAPKIGHAASRPQGADPLPEGGVRHRLWAPAAESIEVLIYDETGRQVRRSVPLEKEGEEFFSIVDDKGKAGELYQYRLKGDRLPDPFSRWQPGDVSGPSMVVDPAAYRWRVSEWERLPLRESVIYELHVGTFTRDGTFRAAIEKLHHLVELGVTTIELMPVAAFAGRRNWGYDGAMLFAPDSSYGHPDDLRALVDAAHERGLNVLIDLVYNHFGPAGNYLGRYSPYYFNPDLKTPWGDAINFSGDHSRHVRAVFLANAAYWLDEFRLDGFRLDATHEIPDTSTPHLLTEIARICHERGTIVLAEDDRNLASLALPPEEGGSGLDGLWADDFHHTIRVALTGRREGYFANFEGTPEELAQTLHHGWFYSGQVAPATLRERGTPPGKLRLEQLVDCISNHDQTGNHALGERLGHLVSAGAYRAASALLCLTPGTPLLFMGQEWNASTPFLYFTDHHDELGQQVTEGRRREFKDFIEALHRQGDKEVEIPGPQEELTFIRSKLQWDESGLLRHGHTLALYRDLLKLRRETPAIRNRDRKNCRVELLGDGIVGIRFQDTAHSGLLVLIDLQGGHRWTVAGDPFARLPSGWSWQRMLSTNDSRFGGDGSSALDPGAAKVLFHQPETILLQPAQVR